MTVPLHKQTSPSTVLTLTEGSAKPNRRSEIPNGQYNHHHRVHFDCDGDAISNFNLLLVAATKNQQRQKAENHRPRNFRGHVWVGHREKFRGQCCCCGGGGGGLLSLGLLLL
jgi:hypothetical protein